MKTTKDDVIKSLKENHIWLNAAVYRDPTDQQLLDLGKAVFSNLRYNAIPKLVEESDVEGMSEEGQKTMYDLAELTPTLYLSINKS